MKSAEHTWLGAVRSPDCTHIACKPLCWQALTLPMAAVSQHSTPSIKDGLLPVVRRLYHSCFTDPILASSSDDAFLDLCTFCHEPDDCIWILIHIPLSGEPGVVFGRRSHAISLGHKLHANAGGTATHAAQQRAAYGDAKLLTYTFSHADHICQHGDAGITSAAGAAVPQAYQLTCTWGLADYSKLRRGRRHHRDQCSRGDGTLLVGMATAVPYTKSLYAFNLCVLPELRCVV